ncbi:MAG: 3-phosphoshikimate 1-carboxyvinyltransferase [Rhodospirillaceae bacterium]
MLASASPLKAVSAKAKPLRGAISVPGDKSISHRALMLGALAVGETRISGLLTGEDVLRTAAAMRALGAMVNEIGGIWSVRGRGVGGLREPADVLDMGNSGTAARLLAGLLSAYPFTSFLTGDASLRGRPMDRVINPLGQTGAKFASRTGGRLPMAITGASFSGPLSYASPIASAQVKSAILLAGLHAPGVTTVTEPAPSRDHTERMLRYFGAEVATTQGENGAYTVRLKGQPELTGRPVVVPGDPSSAAFPVVAAILVPGSFITVSNVGMNPLRTGLFTTLREMGADIQVTNARDEAGEPVADLIVKSSKLHGVNVPAARAPSMIDEYPILAVAAAFAEGQTRMEGLSELKVKESDRLAAMANGLQSCGISATAEGDTLTVRGGRPQPTNAAPITVNLDHRIAMSFLVLGMAGASAVVVDDASAISTSFPGFLKLMNGLGADMQEIQ